MADRDRWDRRRFLALAGGTTILAGCAAEPIEEDQEADNGNDDVETDDEDEENSEDDGEEPDGESENDGQEDTDEDTDNESEEADDGETEDEVEEPEDVSSDDEEGNDTGDDESDEPTEDDVEAENEDVDAEEGETDADEDGDTTDEGGDSEVSGEEDEADEDDETEDQTDDDQADESDDADGEAEGVTDEAPELTVSVVDSETNDPIEGATVRAYLADRETDGPVMDTETGSEGEVTEPLGKQAFEIHITHPNYESATVEYTHEERSSIEVELDTLVDENVEIVAIDPETGDPLENSEVTIVDDRSYIITDDDGVAAVELDPGEYTVVVTERPMAADRKSHV